MDDAAKREKFYNRHKNAKSIRGKILFSMVFMVKSSPHYDEAKATQMLEDLNDPAGYFHLFMWRMEEERYIEAFEYFKEFEPHLYTLPPKNDLSKDPEFTELQIWYFHLGAGFVKRYEQEMKYLRETGYERMRYCNVCEPFGKFCPHLELRKLDVDALQRMRNRNV